MVKYVFTNVIAKLGAKENGSREIVIEIDPETKEIETCAKMESRAKKWLVGQVERLWKLVRTNITGREVPLASESAPLRIGGFLQIEKVEKGKKGKSSRSFLLVKRDEYASRMPLRFDISAGVFGEEWSDPFEMMYGETVEILRINDEDTVFIPRIEDIKDMYDKNEDIMYDSLLNKIKKEYIKICSKTLLKNFDLQWIDKACIMDANPESRPQIRVCYGKKKFPKKISISFELGTKKQFPSLELVGFVEITPPNNIRYEDGESANGQLLRREIYKIDYEELCQPKPITVWQYDECSKRYKHSCLSTCEFNNKIQRMKKLTGGYTLTSKVVEAINSFPFIDRSRKRELLNLLYGCPK